MRKILLSIFVLVFWVNIFAQTDVYNKGTTLTIKSGTTVHINGSFTHAPKDGVHTEVVSEGEIHLTGDFENQTEKNVFTGFGKVVFYGDLDQQIIGDTSIFFHKIEVNKSSNEVELAQAIDISDSLQLIEGNFHLNGFDIELGDFGNLIGETNDNRVYGQSGGVLRATRTLSSNTGDIAGLGLEIESSVSLGESIIERGHLSQLGAGTGGILRYYEIEPTNTGDVLDRVIINYLDDNEFDGKSEAKFSLWQSENGGVVWSPLVSNPTGSSDQRYADDVVFVTDNVRLTVAESTCLTVPIVDLVLDTAYLCLTDTLVLDAQNPGLFYFWSGGENTQTIEVLAGGEYHVAVRDANGCVGYDTIQVIEKPYPIVGFDVDFVCQNNTTNFVNTSTIGEDTMAFHWDFGVLTLDTDTTDIVQASYLYDTAGVYTVQLTATSDYQCISSTQETYVVHPLPEVAFTVEDVCLNANNTFTNTTSILASQGAFTYSVVESHWDFGVISILSDTSNEVSPTYIYPEDNSYDVQLISESNSGCSDTLTKSLTIHPRAVVDFDFTDVCSGFDIQLGNLSTLSSGTKSYKWDFGDGLFSFDETPSKTYVTAGQYDVELTVVSDQSCEDSITKQVTVYDLPVAEFTLNDTCANTTVSLANTSSIVSTDVLSYLWSLGDNTVSTDTDPIKSYVIEGDYDVKLVVTSDKSCTDSVTESITIMPVPVVQFSFVNVCKGNDVTFQNFSQVTSGSYSSSWDFGNSNTSSLKNPIENYPTAGSYDVTLTAKSSFGCEDTLTQSLEIYELPTFNIPSTVGTCVGTYTLDAENVGSSYIWSDNSTNQTLVVTSSGTYSVQVTNVNNCIASHQSTVSLDATFVPSLGEDVSACDLRTLDAGNVGSQSYLWSTGEITKELIVTESGEYIVEIVDQNGCDGSDTIDVVINASPTVDLGSALDFCLGESGVIDAQNVGSAYLWSTGEATQMITVSTANTYSVVVTTPENCSSTGQVDALVNTLPVVDLGDDQAVCDSVTLDAQNSGLVYLWSDASFEQTFWTDQAGEYWVEVKNGNNCISQDTITITIAPKPIVDLGSDQTACSGGQVLLDAENTGETFEWQNGTDLQTLLVSSTGDYGVTVTNSFNCSASSQVTITVEDLVQVELGNDAIVCLGQSLDLDVLNVGSTYAWGSDNGFVSDDQTVSLSDSGAYWVSVTTPNQCVGVDTIHVTVSKDTVYAEFLAVSLIDIGDTIQFLSLSYPDNVSYLWNFDDGITSTSEDPQHIFQSVRSFDVSLVVSNEFCSATVTKEITVSNLREIPTQGPFASTFNQIIRTEAYPNPTEGPFSLEVELEQEGDISVFLYDLKGTRLIEKVITTDLLEEEFDISNLSSAVYLLKVQVGDDMKVLKMVKR